MCSLSGSEDINDIPLPITIIKPQHIYCHSGNPHKTGRPSGESSLVIHSKRPDSRRYVAPLVSPYLETYSCNVLVNSRYSESAPSRMPKALTGPIPSTPLILSTLSPRRHW